MSTVLDKLEDTRVFSVVKMLDGPDAGSFWFQERCDNYFDCTLTKDELLQLSEELKELALN